MAMTPRAMETKNPLVRKLMEEEYGKLMKLLREKQDGSPHLPII